MEGNAPPAQVDFKHALAVAVVQRRRYEAEIQRLRKQLEVLQQEMAGLHFAAKENDTLCTQSHLLSALLEPQPTAASPPVDAAKQESPLQNLLYWQRATELLPPELQGFLGRLQRYLVLKEAREKTGKPAGAILQRTPLCALLEGISDVMEHSMDTTDDSLAAPLEQCIACLAALSAQPTQAFAATDADSLQHFIAWLLNLLCNPAPAEEGAHGSAGEAAGDAPEQHLLDTQNANTTGATSNLEAAGSTLENLVLQVLHHLSSGPGTGLVLLACTTEAVLADLQALAAVITGELGTGTPPPAAAATGEGNELALLQAVSRLMPLLHTCLRSLPAWTAEVVPADDFICSVAAAVWGSSEACKPIALTHGVIARQAQRATALLMTALQQMSRNQGGLDGGTASSV